MIVGGWEYIKAAYGITALVLTAYPLYLCMQWRKENSSHTP
jgi:hypothetical protein